MTRQALEQALHHHKAGRLNEAEAVYRQVLAVEPREPDALHLLGLVALQGGRLDIAGDLVSRAIEVQESAQFRHSLGEILCRRGNEAEAVVHFERALELNPTLASSFNILLDLAMRKSAPLKLSPALLKPPPMLKRLQIEVTTWCNLKCAGCPRTIGIAQGRWSNKHMNVEVFRNVVDRLPPSEAVCLQGVGESTLHPQFCELVAIARDSGKYHWITLNTNALARDMNYYEELHKAGITGLSVSVDSLDQETADACRFGTPVEKLRARLTELATRFRNIAVSIVLSRRNLEDVANTIAAMEAIGVSFVEVQPLIDYGGDVGTEWALRPADVDRAKAILEGCRRCFPRLSIQSSGPIRDDALAPRCIRPFLAPFVTIDGFLTPCCTAQDPALLGYTSVLQKTFAEAWRSEPVQRWLSLYLDASPEICHGCCFYSGD